MVDIRRQAAAGAPRSSRRFRLAQQGSLACRCRPASAAPRRRRRSDRSRAPAPCDRCARLHQDGAAAAEGIEHQATTARAILDRVRHQCGRFDRWVHRQLFQPSRPHGVDAGIIPDVAAMAPVLPKLEIVGVRCGPGLQTNTSSCFASLQKGRTSAV
jgi:hypothetical protein